MIVKIGVRSKNPKGFTISSDVTEFFYQGIEFLVLLMNRHEFRTNALY